MVAVLGFNREQILSAVREMYTDVALEPERLFHFPTGRDACLFVGYPAQWLDALPETVLESFAGVGFPFRADVIRLGNAILDVGSGSGTDVLCAARLVGHEGEVFALDMTPAMLTKLSANLEKTGAVNVSVLEGNAESIPLPDESVDVVTSNGVLNLVPNKVRAFAEIFRVLRLGGFAQIADIVVAKPISDSSRANPRLWAECVVGASIEDDYLDMFRSVGFEDVRVLRGFDYFSGSSHAHTRRVAGALGARAIEISMSKPGRTQLGRNYNRGEHSIHEAMVGGRKIARRPKVKAFLERPIDGEWPYLWIDATYLTTLVGYHHESLIIPPIVPRVAFA